MRRFREGHVWCKRPAHGGGRYHFRAARETSGTGSPVTENTSDGASRKQGGTVEYEYISIPPLSHSGVGFLFAHPEYRKGE